MLSFVASAPALPQRCGRAGCGRVAVPRCAAGGAGRDAEFAPQNQPRRRAGVPWARWRATPGEKAPMPLLPFDAHHVMLPGEEKTLHLFEARYLALFDEAVLNYQKRFGHILLSHERSALAASGTLVQVSSFERMEIGVKLQIHGIGRIQVSAVELSGSAPYILGSVAYVEDVDEEEEPQQDVDELLALEETFWRGALRLVDLSVELGLEPFRSKRHTIPPTISDDAFGATGSPPPGDGSDAAAKKANYVQQLREAVERASWPAAGAAGEEEESGGALSERERTRCRLRAVSFVGFELFPSDAGVRQRALENKSTVGRFRTVLAGVKDRLQVMDAQLALRRAFL